MGAAAERGAAASAEDLFRAHARGLWGLAYRLTGSAQDADDVVQEAFARLIERPPSGDPPLGPWLVRVATNLGIDALRRRRRRPYAGSWLPAPAEAADEEWRDRLASREPDPEARYGLLESASYAFLLALEALGPRQRAVLLLRDVLGHSAAETAAAIGTSEGNVRLLHLRARRALAGYDRARCIPTPELRARHRAALEGFLACLLTQDASALERLLAESAFAATDAGGAYTALAAPLHGRARVATFFLRAALHRRESAATTEIRIVNALPAALITLGSPVRRQAPRSVLQLELDPAGCIRAIRAILAPRKLGAVRFGP